MAKYSVAQEAAPGFFVSVFKPLFIALFFTFLSLCLLAACIAYGPVTEAAAGTCILLSTLLCIFLAGFLAARRRRTKGFLMGSLAGILYVAMAYIISVFAFGNFTPGAGLWKLLGLGVGVGAFGGITGINIRLKRR